MHRSIIGQLNRITKQRANWLNLKGKIFIYQGELKTKILSENIKTLTFNQISRFSIINGKQRTINKVKRKIN